MHENKATTEYPTISSTSFDQDPENEGPETISNSPSNMNQEKVQSPTSSTFFQDTMPTYAYSSPQTLGMSGYASHSYDTSMYFVSEPLGEALDSMYIVDSMQEKYEGP
jgi:hypothetical protein